jgi:hypothetical protein
MVHGGCGEGRLLLMIVRRRDLGICLWMLYYKSSMREICECRRVDRLGLADDLIPCSSG